MSLSVELNLDVPISDLRHETLLNILHTAGRLSQTGQPLFRRYDLTEAQFNVLFCLRHAKVNLTQSDLGRRLVITRASITSLLDKLEEKGLVVRNEVPNNRRIYHVALTDSGRELINMVEPLYREEVHRVIGVLSEADCRTLIGFLERIRQEAMSA